MKKNVLSILCLVMILIFTFTACSTSSGDKGSDPAKSGTDAANTDKSGNGGSDGKLADPNVKIFFWEEPDEDTLAAIAGFEEQYGGKLNYSVIAWDQLELKTMAAMGAGEPPDVLYIHSANFPRVAVKSMAQPINDYIDVNDPLWDKNTVDSYKWKGENYGVSTGGSAVYIWFNKTMFENNGTKTPLEYYSEGQWNFENFKKVAKELTQDLDRDGNIDQWGYASWRYEVFVLANSGEFVRFTDDGSIEPVMDNPKTLEGMQFMQDGYFKDKYIMPDGNVKSYSEFQAGKVAMIAEQSWAARVHFKDKMKDEWDVAPFPVGAGNDKGVFPGDTSVWGLTTGARNPQGAAAFIKAYSQYFKDKNDEIQLKTFSSQQLSLIDEINGKIVLPRYGGIGNWWNKQWSMWSDIFAGTPPATAVAKYTPILKSEIELTLADNTLPNVQKFEAVPKIDFESGDLGGVTTKGGYNTDSVKAVSDDKEVIDGKYSLKAQLTKDQEWAIILRTDETKVKLPSYHAYKISFDYKVLTDMPEDGYYFIAMRPLKNLEDGGINFGWILINAKKAGETGKFEGEITIDKDTEDNCLVLGAYKGGDLLVDNLEITEK